MSDILNETVLITCARLKELHAAEDRLARLEAAGVDNWEGYDEALRTPEEGEEA